jgi:hypothetical protein
MQFKVTFEDIFYNCENEIQAYDALLEYLNQCVRNEDVEGFNFELIPETEPEPKTTGYNPMNRSGNL